MSTNTKMTTEGQSFNSTVNYSRLVFNGDIVSVQVNVVTEIRDNSHLDVLLRAMLRAASLEEHKVSKMTKSPEELIARIQSYLSKGGLFNPEIMEHQKVRKLITDCLEFLEFIHHAKA